MSVDRERKHTFLQQLLLCGLSGKHERHFANETRAATPFYSARGG